MQGEWEYYYGPAAYFSEILFKRVSLKEGAV